MTSQQKANSFFTWIMAAIMAASILVALEIGRENRADERACLPYCIKAMGGTRAYPIGATRRDRLCYCTAVVVPE